MSLKKFYSEKLQPLKMLYIIILYLFLIGFGQISASESTLKTDLVKKPMTLKDIMTFHAMQEEPILSEQGNWVLYSSKQNIGNHCAYLYNVRSGNTIRIERGGRPVISKDEKWIALQIRPDIITRERLKIEKEKNPPESDLRLINTITKEEIDIKSVQSYQFSKDSIYLLTKLYPKKTSKIPEQQKNEAKNQPDTDKKKAKKSILQIRHLSSGKVLRIEQVKVHVLDPSSRYLAYVQSVTDLTTNSKKKAREIFIIQDLNHQKIIKQFKGGSSKTFHNLCWSAKGSRLAFIQRTSKGKDSTENSLMIFDGMKQKAIRPAHIKQISAEWMLPTENQLQWSKNGERLFFGLKPVEEYCFTSGKKKKKSVRLTRKTLYDLGRLRENRKVDVWHWNDPFINPHQKKNWKKLKKQTYLAVYHFKSKRLIQLGNHEIPKVIRNENPQFALGFSNLPYRKELTWDGRYNDVYLIPLKSGKPKKILTRSRGICALSPDGSSIVYFKDRHWYRYDTRKHSTRNLTAALDIPFQDEDYDYPALPRSYGIAGWLKDKRGDSILIYDKYDIWQFNRNGKAVCLTESAGRKSGIRYRLVKRDTKKTHYLPGEQILLEGLSESEKYQHLFSHVIGRKGIKVLVNDQKDRFYRYRNSSKDGQRILYSRENFREFPDLWVSDPTMSSPLKISDLNPQIRKLRWGNGSLLSWESVDGKRLQGALFKPENFDPARKYPVLVYYYRFMSQRVHRFNQVIINHRPCFPYYTSNDYIVFLPDIRFDIGRPGYSAVKCIIPGVQKLIAMGIANPEAIALHGHSWSGYQTAHVITQTDLFACAIAGAPVSNMTSAYSGIRWGSGMARQFQYEKSQSRIGPSLYDAPHLYIENSPVFFAKRINTPLLIQHGDRDEAVPWYQAIELYLAMRRLGKDCIFLQYNDEPHHLKKYANKLDYTIKFKSFLDHHLKGKPAPTWMTKGIPYQK